MGGPSRDAFTDDELADVWIGEPTRVDGQIHLSDPDPAWAYLYRNEAARIRSALGEKALLVEHVGSTSVPGLVAKPRIDVLLAVFDSGDEAAYVPALEAAGYTLAIREPDWFEHRVLRGPAYDTNLHVFTVGCDEIERMIAFRNHLRSNTTDRDLYASVKRDLARREWKYVQNYADAKSEVIADIMSRVSGSGDS